MIDVHVPQLVNTWKSIGTIVGTRCNIVNKCEQMGQWYTSVRGLTIGQASLII